MSETSWSAIFSHGDSYALNLTAALEEFLDGPLLGSETKVSNENSSGFTTSCGTSLVTSSSLTGEFNPDASTIKFFLVGLLLGLSSSGVISILDECLTLVVKDLALGELTILSEERVEGVLIGVEVHTLNEEFSLSVVLVTDSWGIGLHLFILFSWLGIRLGVRITRRVLLGGLLLWCWLLLGIRV